MQPGNDELQPTKTMVVASRFGRYQIERELGRGGMGVVYAALDPQLQRTVAIKIIGQAMSGDNERRRFIREANLMAKLDHPNIIKIFDVGEEAGRNFFTMELVEGESFNRLLAKNCPLPQLLRILVQAAQAVHYAHEHGVIHRDLKPSNIMVTADGTAKVMDFGLAKDTGEKGQKLSKSQEMMGTPEYMSPEQAAGKSRNVDARSDVYALGVILYEILTGKPPFTGTTMNILYKIGFEDAVPPSHFYPRLARDLETICLKAVEKDRLRRYQSAREFAEDIERYLRGDLIQARHASWAYKTYKWVMRHKYQTALAAVCGIFLPVFVYLSWLAPGSFTLVSKNATGEVVHPQVMIDNRRLDGKNWHKIALSPGYHRLQLSLAGYETQETLLEISSRKEVKLETTLKRKKGKLTITSALAEIEANFKNVASGMRQQMMVPVYNAEMETGEYEVTFNKQNYFPQQRRIEVRADNKMPASLYVDLQPMLLWRREVGDSYGTNNIVLADSDRDGRLELVCFSRAASVYAYDLQSFQQIWTAPFGLPIYSYPFRLHDINRDGVTDFVLGHQDSFTIVDGKSHRRIVCMPKFWGSHFILDDVNGDSYDDIVLLKSHQIESACYDFVTQRMLWENKLPADNTTAAPVEIFPHHFVYGGGKGLHMLDVRSGLYTTIYQGINSLDALLKTTVDQSGQTLLVGYSCRHGIFCLESPSWRLRWRTKSDIPVGTRGISLLDANGDGRPEVLLNIDKLYCLDILSGQELWQFDTGNKLDGFFPCVADLDNDGQLEVIVHSQLGKLYILDGRDGRQKSEFVCPPQAKNIIPWDIDNDNVLEILLLANDEVYCIRYLPQHEKRVFAQDPLLFMLPAVADLDQDGCKEIVIGNTAGDIYCLQGKTWEEQWRYNMRNPVNNHPVIADLDHDRLPEILVHGHEKLVVLDRHGKLLSEVKLDEAQSRKSPVVADVNGDGRSEIVVSGWRDGTITCLSFMAKKLQTVWKTKVGKMLSQPQVADVDKDGELEVLLISGERPENNRGAVFCLRGKDGVMKWKSKVPMQSEGGEIALCDIDHDGVPEVFAPQVSGYISCLDGNSGALYWQQRVRSGDIGCKPIVQDADGDGRYEIIFSGGNDDIQCLDAATGRPKWGHMLWPEANTAFDTDLIRFNTRLFASGLDIDEDGCPDFVTSNSKYSFYLFSGKDGSWLGDTQDYGYIDIVPRREDIDGDGKDDILFIDRKSRIICIYDVSGYLASLYRQPRMVGGQLQPASTLWHARFNKLAAHKAYGRLHKTLPNYEEQAPGSDYLSFFYRGLCALGQHNPQQAVSFFARCDAAPSSFFDSRFLQAVARLNLQQTAEAVAILRTMLPAQVVDFENAYRRYRHLLTPQGIAAWRAMLPGLLQQSKCDTLLSGIHTSAMLSDRPDAAYFLELYLKYSRSGHPDYPAKRDQYVREVLDFLKNASSNYARHEAFDILEHALDVLPDSPQLLEQRGRLYQEYNNYQEALADLQRAISIDKDNPSLVLSHGAMLLLLKQPQQALQELKRLQPTAVLHPLYGAFAEILQALAQGRKQEALKKAQPQVQILAQDQWLLNVIGLLLQN